MTLSSSRITPTRNVYTASLLAGMAVAAAITLFASCGDDGTVSPNPNAVATVVVTPKDPDALTVPQTLQVSAVTKSASGATLTGRTITWSSSDETVATVDASGLVTAVAPGMAAIRATSEGVKDSTLVAVSPAPVQIEAGAVIGQALFPDGDTQQGGQGQQVGQATCLGGEQLAFHIHAQVSLFINGEQVALPKAVGVTNASFTQYPAGPYVTGGTCWYWIHTHDASGVVHVEAPVQTTLTVGDLFAIWGRSLSSTELVGQPGTVIAWVDGKRDFRDPRDIELAPHRQITLEVGTPLAPPPQYLYPPGL